VYSEFRTVALVLS